MAVTINARGTSNQQFQIGKKGPVIKNNGGVLEFKNADDSAFIEIKGGTGVNGDSLVTRDYVDSKITGLDIKQSVRVATTQALSGTYSAVSDDESAGATPWTNLGSSLIIDGVTLADDDRILVKNETTNNKGNGIFVVGGTGSSVTLSRADDADNHPEIEVSGSMFAFVEEGTTNAGTGWVLTSPAGDVTLGTDALIFGKFSSSTSPVTSIFGRTGAVTASAGDYEASEITNTPAGNISATTVQAAIDELDSEKGTVNSVTIGAGDLITVSGGPITDSGTITVAVDLSDLTTSVSDGDGDYFVVVDSANAQKKLTKSNINLSGFNNDSSWIALTDLSAAGDLSYNSSTGEFSFTETYSTASELLTAIKTVDGDSSGLDADQLDGQEGSYYTNATNITSGTLPSAQLPDLVVADFAGSAIQTSAESFADSDSVLMTAAAIDDRIAAVSGLGSKPTITESTTSRTLSLSDAGSYLRTTNSSQILITVPAESSVNFDDDTEIIIFQAGSGQAVIDPDSGVTINSKSSYLALSDQYASATLKKITGDTWDLIGDLGETIITDLTLDYIIVAGGGGGGNNLGGGGGGGGVREFTSQVLSPGAYTVTIGAGGSTASDGSDSSFNGHTSAGGGAGGNISGNTAGQPGGSGGGGSGAIATSGGAGNTPSTSPVQGYNGGSGSSNPGGSTGRGGGGGGGGSEAGQNGAVGVGSGYGGDGGDGYTSTVTPSGTVYGGGGGGGSDHNAANAGAGGAGGGAAGGKGTTGSNAGGNTGGGGGGGGNVHPSGYNGGSGGSGIVVIRYLGTTALATGGSITNDGTYTYHTFTGSGTFTVT